MKSFALTVLFALSATQAFAAVGVYTCWNTAHTHQASLVVYPAKPNVDWMPENGLKTTKANAEGFQIESGEYQFPLFGFQDQIDNLVLPKEAITLPKSMKVYTYLDDDDVMMDREDFNCQR